MKKMKKAKKLFTFLTVLLFVGVICIAGYVIYDSYFLKNRKSSYDNPIFVAYPLNANIIIDSYNPNSGVGSVLFREGTTYNVSVTSSYEQGTECKYALVWEWDVDNASKYIKTNTDKKEFTISVNNQEVEVNNYDDTNLSTVLLNDNISVSPDKISSKTYDLKFNFYKVVVIIYNTDFFTS